MTLRGTAQFSTIFARLTTVRPYRGGTSHSAQRVSCTQAAKGMPRGSELRPWCEWQSPQLRSIVARGIDADDTRALCKRNLQKVLSTTTVLGESARKATRLQALLHILPRNLPPQTSLARPPHCCQQRAGTQQAELHKPPCGHDARRSACHGAQAIGRQRAGAVIDASKSHLEHVTGLLTAEVAVPLPPRQHVLSSTTTRIEGRLKQHAARGRRTCLSSASACLA